MSGGPVAILKAESAIIDAAMLYLEAATPADARTALDYLVCHCRWLKDERQRSGTEAEETGDREIEDDIATVIGLVEGANPTPEQIAKIKALGRLSIDLITFACNRGKADSLEVREVIAAVRMGLRSLQRADAVLAAARKLEELGGDG